MIAPFYLYLSGHEAYIRLEDHALSWLLNHGIPIIIIIIIIA
jgi:hypothetical protein